MPIQIYMLHAILMIVVASLLYSNAVAPAVVVGITIGGILLRLKGSLFFVKVYAYVLLIIFLFLTISILNGTPEVIESSTINGQPISPESFTTVGLILVLAFQYLIFCNPVNSYLERELVATKWFRGDTLSCYIAFFLCGFILFSSLEKKAKLREISHDIEIMEHRYEKIKLHYVADMPLNDEKLVEIVKDERQYLDNIEYVPESSRDSLSSVEGLLSEIEDLAKNRITKQASGR